MRSFYTLPLRVISHNIRYATTSPFKGEELWPVRAPRLLSELRFHTTYNQESFICMQEVLHSQLVNILTGLNNDTSRNASYSYIEVDPAPQSDEWTYIGVGRDDGKQAGEYSPIFYRPAIWQLEDSKSIWLSETPDVPSKGWDAASIRILTVGRFRHRASRRQVLMLCTHLDDQGAVSRQKSAELITTFVRDYLHQYGNATELPVILAGDFNSEPTEEAYQYLNGPSSLLRDTRERIPPERRYGNENTFTGFSEEDGPPKRIDFIFAGPLDNATFDVTATKGYAVLSNRFDDGVYISDHRAVVGDFVL